MKIDKNELTESVIVASISIIMAILFYFGWEKSLRTSLLILIISLSSIILYSIFTSFIPKEETKQETQNLSEDKKIEVINSNG
ncbi:MAG: hypothetical protein AABY22_01520 [Nanoarchaeota archaeon]